MGKNIGNGVNVCLLFGCSMCCNPVKIDSRRLIDPKREGFPFVELEGILAPESNPDTIRLKQYRCTLFNAETGLCGNYENRPTICRNTRCRAFEVVSYLERKKIVEGIKQERFFKIGFGG